MGNAKQAMKTYAIRHMPRAWVLWREFRRPRTAETELRFLDRIVGAPDTTVDVGANLGLYTRRLAKLGKKVHAFEPGREMAALLRRTVPANVVLHEVALSDKDGDADLMIPEGKGGPGFSTASLNHEHLERSGGHTLQRVALRRLDAEVTEPVRFVKIDVEGHEMSVVSGATRLIDRCRPVFLIEAEDRHQPGAVDALRKFFEARGYIGLFLLGETFAPISEFDTVRHQDPSNLLHDGGRAESRPYINNFFFCPSAKDVALLRGAAGS
jgi:FkbM family methyltransferase